MYLTLNNGVPMPCIGYGTYQMSPGITARCVTDALRVGYRMIDTAQCYGNEREVGVGCKNSGLTREELFLTTKLWACHGYSDTLRSIDGSMKALGMDYIDLLLIHEPTGNVHEIYGAMETAYQAGKLRAIGISNFMEDRYLDLVRHCNVIPAVNQVETHVFRQQKALRALEAQMGTVHESWSPLACGQNHIFEHMTLVDIAHAHGKTVAQVALRFLAQQGIVVIPKSTREERMKENLDIFDFELDHDEMQAIEQLEVGTSFFGWW